jgi:hypothetical protein
MRVIDLRQCTSRSIAEARASMYKANRREWTVWRLAKVGERERRARRRRKSLTSDRGALVRTAGGQRRETALHALSVGPNSRCVRHCGQEDNQGRDEKCEAHIVNGQ